jgi:dipeptidyl aminopeptidase/acylaminoacyl peptidase
MNLSVRRLLPASLALVMVPGIALAVGPLHSFTQVAVSPDGGRVATLEANLPADARIEPAWRIVIRAASRDDGQAVTVALPCQGADCVPSSLAWAPGGHLLAFVLKQPRRKQRFVYAVRADGTKLTRLLAFDGTLEGLRYAPDGSLAVLATAGAHKEPGATQAAAKPSGEIGASEDEQRIATIEAGTLRWQSPADLYVYEYDWVHDRTQPSPARFVGTAAHGNGDNNWWSARLYDFEHETANLLYAPPQRQQLATPVVSADGGTVAFIGGIMSDFGSTGGDAFLLPLDGHATPRNLTPGLHASITSLSWSCGGGLTAGALAGSKTELLALDQGPAPRLLWSGEEDLSHGGWTLGAACGGGTSAAIHQSFTRAPELEAGPVGNWHDLTHVNAAQTVPVTAQSITWRNDGFDVQGWLLSPSGARTGPGAAKGPMIVDVHGGPSAAEIPTFLTLRDSALYLLQAGYRVFLPNARGSFGQGEAFTQANVRDLGHGDLRDILTGIDAVERIAPVDDARLGLTGYSYGGYMTMWAVTQTSRFKAAVAGAGVANWQSYYGQNGIDQWMLPFFGGSVYDDPEIYAKSSPIAFIKQVKTPTLEYVGDSDVECPMPQTQEFYHALHTLGVPTQFVVYAGQGHGLKDPKDRADARQRTLAWFARYLGSKATLEAAGGKHSTELR